MGPNQLISSPIDTVIRDEAHLSSIFEAISDEHVAIEASIVKRAVFLASPLYLTFLYPN